MIPMNDKVTLLKRIADQDAAGQPVESWDPVGPDRWANVKWQSGVEVMRANTDVSIVKCSIRIRVTKDADASMRARHKGVVYDIRAVMPDSSDRGFIFLVCESVK